MRSFPGCILSALVLPLFGACAGASTIELDLAGRQLLPTPMVEGTAARIHTQGLLVTDNFYYITGRLETPPKRALLLRVGRRDWAGIEYVDITPESEDGDAARLDHPGGFDSDGESLWIPVAESRRGGQSVVFRFPLRNDVPLGTQRPEMAFRVDDHIGAIAVDRARKRLYGANWDTEHVYVWTFEGEQVERIDRTDVVSRDAEWALAVQDWKCVGPGRVLAGGIDKSPDRDPALPSAVVEILDLDRRRRIATTRVTNPSGSNLPVTNEGLALRGADLYLLPGDLGHRAEVFRYRLRVTRPSDRRESDHREEVPARETERAEPAGR